MAAIEFYETRIIGKGATLPILELAVTEADRLNAINLANYGVAVAFWYVGQPIHVVRQGYVYDAAGGLARLAVDGTESPTVGTLLYQWELCYPGLVDFQAAQASVWGNMSSHVFRRNIVEVAP